MGCDTIMKNIGKNIAMKVITLAAAVGFSINAYTQNTFDPSSIKVNEIVSLNDQINTVDMDSMRLELYGVDGEREIGRAHV